MLDTCREMERLAAHTRNPRYTALALLGQGHAWLRVGDLAQAEAALDRARERLPGELGQVPEAVTVGLAAVCALRQGHRARAEALALSAVDAVRRARGTIAELRYPLICILEVYLSADHPERHAAQIRPAFAQLRRIARRFPFAEPNAWMFQGRLDALRGRPARAATALRRALRAARRLESRYEEAHARFWLGRLAQGAGGARHVPEGAVPHLRAAHAAFARLGCAWEAGQAREALDRAEGGEG